MKRASVKVRIRGRVQGVWYRAWTREKARGLGLAGWARNRRDGSVEALFSGPETAVAKMLRACHEGPAAARVSGVESDPADPPDGQDFLILATK